METDRRSFVKATGLAAVLGTTGLAGCSGLLGGGGDASGWLYDPSVVAEVPNVAFGSMDYGTFYDNRDQLPASMQEGFTTDPDSPIQPGDIETLAGVGGGDVTADMQSASAFGTVVVTGSFPTSEIESEIEAESEVQPAGSYQDYSLYSVSDLGDGVTGVPASERFQGSGAVAVGEGAMLIGLSAGQGTASPATGTATVETMIDASAGNARRLGDRDGPVTEVQSEVGESMVSVGAEVDPELVTLAQRTSGMGGMQGQLVAGIRGGGFGMDIDGSTTTGTVVAVYDSSQSATDAGLADLVSGMSARFEEEPGITTVSAEQNGAVVVVTVEGDTDTLLEQGAGSGTTFHVEPTGTAL